MAGGTFGNLPRADARSGWFGHAISVPMPGPGPLARRVRRSHKDAHNHGYTAQYKTDRRRLRHLGHIRFRVSLGLLVDALGFTHILTRKNPLGNSEYLAVRHGQRDQSQPEPEPLGRAVRVAIADAKPAHPLSPQGGPGHRRRRHGRISARPAPRARRSRDPGRCREHRLPQEGHQEPLTLAVARQAGPIGAPSHRQEWRVRPARPPLPSRGLPRPRAVWG
jgi:hypothetical protein